MYAEAERYSFFLINVYINGHIIWSLSGIVTNINFFFEDREISLVYLRRKVYSSLLEPALYPLRD